MKVYDNQFNANEWFVLIAVSVGILVVLVLPRRFTRMQTILFYMLGVYSGFFFDHTLSVQPVSYYDVNDVSKFQVIDFISYWMYGPLSYLFCYIVDWLHIRPSRISVFILMWSLVGFGIECVAVKVGVFHYLHGYRLWYSFPIYLLTESAWAILFYRFASINKIPKGRLDT